MILAMFCWRLVDYVLGNTMRSMRHGCALPFVRVTHCDLWTARTRIFSFIFTDIHPGGQIYFSVFVFDIVTFDGRKAREGSNPLVIPLSMT